MFNPLSLSLFFFFSPLFSAARHAACGIRPGFEPMSPALGVGVLTTGLRGGCSVLPVFDSHPLPAP